MVHILPLMPGGLWLCCSCEDTVHFLTKWHQLAEMRVAWRTVIILSGIEIVPRMVSRIVRNEVDDVLNLNCFTIHKTKSFVSIKATIEIIAINNFTYSRMNLFHKA